MATHHRAATLAWLLLLVTACATAAGGSAEPGVAQAGATEQGGAAPVSASGPAGGGPLLLFVEPLHTTGVTVKPRKGMAADPAWVVTESEAAILQRSLAGAFAAVFGEAGELRLVDSRKAARLLLSASVTAISPGDRTISARLQVFRRHGGALVLNSLETRSVREIEVFREVVREDPAFEELFRSWAESLRRGLSYLNRKEAAPW